MSDRDPTRKKEHVVADLTGRKHPIQAYTYGEAVRILEERRRAAQRLQANPEEGKNEPDES